MDFLRVVYEGLLQAWRQFSVSARINIALAGAAAAAVVVLVVITGASPQFVTLSDNVGPSQASSIRDALAQGGIDFKIENDNRTITVPLGQRSDAQLLLAQNDLPVGRTVPPGFELFAESDLMTNQWLQDVKYMRAVQGELQRILNAFDFINYSYVLIREADEELVFGL